MADPINVVVDRIPLDDNTYDIYAFDNVLYASYGPIRRVDLRTKEVSIIAPGEPCGVLAFIDFHRPLDGPTDAVLGGTGAPDQRLYVTLQNNQIGEITPARFDSFTPIQVLPKHFQDMFVFTMVGTNSAKYLYMYEHNRWAVCIIDLDAGRMTGSVQLEHWAPAMVISPDDRFIYAAHPLENFVSVIDTASPPTVTKVPVVNGPSGLAISADGKRLFIAGCGESNGNPPTDLNHGTLSVLDTSTMQGQQLFTGRRSSSVAVNKAGTRAYVSNTDDGSVSVVDVSGTPEVTATISGFSDPARMCFSPDEKRLYVVEHGWSPAIAVAAI
jgi:YVTN family beta-propeller protein